MSGRGRTIRRAASPIGTRTLLAKNRRPIKMKTLIAVLFVLFLAPAFAADVPVPPAGSPAKSPVHRYLVERTFPHGVLDSLAAATKKKVNANNATVGVRW